MRVESHGEQLLVSAHGVLALVSAPAGSRGGGVIEGVTHRLSGGDLLVGTDRAAARAWEVCIGTRRTNPDSCAPDGRWVDSRSMPVRWRAEQRPSGDVLRFDWVDEAVGLSVAQEIAVEDDGLRLRLSARALGLASGLVAARFPIVAIDYQGHGGLGAELVLPRGNFGIQCRDCGAFAAMYPGIYQTMPWFGVLKAQAGLYVGAHDPKGSMKRVVVSGPRTPGSSYFEIYPEDSGAAGNAIEPDWSFDVTPVCAERGWPALAHHYKEWMSAHTEWGRAPLLRERDDIPAAVRDGAWWFVHSIVPGAGIDLLEQGTQLWRQGFAGLPTIHHWYEWHTPGMDRGFPTHRPKPGTKEAIARLHANPLTRILLFTNATHSDQSTAPVESGRPPCPNGASEYPRYWHETIQRADFTRVFIVPLSGACLAAMDLTAPGWRGVVLANSDLVTKKLGAAGVYLDVIGNSGEGSWMPVRHPPGRGEWVTRAARELVQAVSNGRELVVVEGALEQMTGISSAGLNYLGSTTDMVPLFSLVHHERFILAGMISLPPDDRHALRIKNGLALAWGLQMGLSSLQWHEPHAARNVAWGAELLRARHRFANWLAYGEYMGPVDQVEAGLSAEKVESKSWGAFIDDRPTVVHQRNPIEASLYRGADGRPALILVNLSERRATARLALPPPFDRARARVVSASEDASKARVVASEGGVLELALAPGAIVRGELLVDGAATGSPAQLPGMPRKAQVSPTRAPGS